jgi:hypothetical protein
MLTIKIELELPEDLIAYIAVEANSQGVSIPAVMVTLLREGLEAASYTAAEDAAAAGQTLTVNHADSPL